MFICRFEFVIFIFYLFFADPKAVCFLGSLCLATITAQVGFAIGTSVMHFHAVVNATGYQTTAQKTSVIQNEKGVGGGGERGRENKQGDYFVPLA